MRSFDWYAVQNNWPSRCRDLKVSGFGHSNRTRIGHVDQGSKVPVTCLGEIGACLDAEGIRVLGTMRGMGGVGGGGE
jgi:hypothetical protein